MAGDKHEIEFSFASHADDFERHIHQSIRGYGDLRGDCLRFSQYFVEDGTTVLDVGCSTGKFLSDVRAYNQARAPAAAYLGLEIEDAFQQHWPHFRAPNLDFALTDVRQFQGYERLSFVTSLFSLQFIPERDRLEILKQIYQGLVEGGALVLAEKTLARSSKIQDMLTFVYYDFKRGHFSEAEILSKEVSLRDKMKLWSEAQIVGSLVKVGFSPENIQVFWRNHLFVGIVAIKGVTLESHVV